MGWFTLHLREDPRCQRRSAGANGVWIANQISGSGRGPDPVQLVTTQTRPPDGDDAFAPVTADAPNGHAQVGPRVQQPLRLRRRSSRRAKLAGFKLKLPPGFLGNPTAARGVPDVPVHRVLVLGPVDPRPSVTETVIDGATQLHAADPDSDAGLQRRDAGPRTRAAWAPAVFPSEPAGPFPIKIDLRTDGDYGIDSALIDIPKNLGGPQALITQIETVLVPQVPCKAADPQDPRTRAAAAARRGRSSATRLHASRRRPRSRRGPGPPNAVTRHQDEHLHANGLQRRAVRPRLFR